MIKIDVSKTANRVGYSGDPVRVAAEVACAIGAIYNGYKAADGRGAELFRLALVHMLMPASGVWNPGEGDLTTIILPGDANKKGGA